MTDEEKLNEITEVFTKSLIKNKFEDKWKYKELAKRLAVLIDSEVMWQTTHEETQILMQTWGGLRN